MTSEEAARALGVRAATVRVLAAGREPLFGTRSEDSMDSAKDLLERAQRAAPPFETTLEGLDRRLARRHARRRVGTIVVAMALAAVALGSAFVALREPGRSLAGSSGPTEPLPPATTHRGLRGRVSSTTGRCSSRPRDAWRKVRANVASRARGST